MGIMCFQINLGCYLDVEFLTKAPGSPALHPVPSRSARTVCSQVGSERWGLRRQVGMALFVAKKSWESLVFLISLKKLHIIGENRFSQRYD